MHDPPLRSCLRSRPSRAYHIRHHLQIHPDQRGRRGVFATRGVERDPIYCRFNYAGLSFADPDEDPGHRIWRHLPRHWLGHRHVGRQLDPIGGWQGSSAQGSRVECCRCRSKDHHSQVRRSLQRYLRSRGLLLGTRRHLERRRNI